jgi:hypothetical protein
MDKNVQFSDSTADSCMLVMSRFNGPAPSPLAGGY